jgi:hypothetical protein
MQYYILFMFNLVMHWINRPLRRAKVDERLSWWSVGQTCYQVPLSTIDKLVVGGYQESQNWLRSHFYVEWECRDTGATNKPLADIQWYR